MTDEEIRREINRLLAEHITCTGATHFLRISPGRAYISHHAEQPTEDINFIRLDGVNPNTGLTAEQWEKLQHPICDSWTKAGL